MTFTRPWSFQNKDGDIVIVDDDPSYMNSRVGNCWMKGRLKAGDVLLCVAHSGDGFHTWVIIDNGISNVIKAHKGSFFGAYGYSGNNVIINSQKLLEAYKNDESLKEKEEISRIKTAIKMAGIAEVMNS